LNEERQPEECAWRDQRHRIRGKPRQTKGGGRFGWCFGGHMRFSLAYVVELLRVAARKCNPNASNGRGGLRTDRRFRPEIGLKPPRSMASRSDIFVDIILIYDINVDLGVVACPRRCTDGFGTT